MKQRRIKKSSLTDSRSFIQKGSIQAKVWKNSWVTVFGLYRVSHYISKTVNKVAIGHC